jgi:two-component response regulator
LFSIFWIYQNWLTLLRQGIQASSEPKTFCVDKQKRTILKNGETIALTKAEFDIFIYFYEKEGIVVSREDILINLGQAKFQRWLKSIDVAIGCLRQKIGDEPKIHTSSTPCAV